MRSQGKLWLSLALASLAGCSDRFPDYRYRMTVEVETPDGLRTGASVVEVRTQEVGSITDSSGRRVKREVSGEAVAVDLAPGRTLYALLGTLGDPDYAKGVAFAALKPGTPKGGDFEDYRRRLVELTRVEGTHELPRDHWPLFVRFNDPTDSTSVEQVHPGSLAEAFGSGVHIRRVTIELTDDSITETIQQRLGWLSDHPEPSLKPGHGPRDFSFAARLNHGFFRREI